MLEERKLQVFVHIKRVLLEMLLVYLSGQIVLVVMMVILKKCNSLETVELR